MLITLPAIRSAQFVWCTPWNVVSPSWSVHVLVE